MSVRKLVCVLAFAVLCAAAALAAEPASPPDAKATEPAAVAAAEKPLEWKDYKVKAYTLSVYGGAFSGGTYFDMMPISARTMVSRGAYPVYAFDGSGSLVEADDMTNPTATARHYNAPRKEIEPGTAFGGRIGIYVADDFHMDLTGSYMSGRAVTTMLYNPDSTIPTNTWNRVEVDEDPGFAAYKGGISLMYDATPAKIFGLKPLIGFGLGGVINRYSVLEDKTALYLEANAGLSAHVARKLDVVARADVCVFAFDVDELGYSNMVSYKNFLVGVTWFLDTVPADVRAKHLAEPKPVR